MQQTQIIPDKVYPNPGKKYAVIEQGGVRYRALGAYANYFQLGQAVNIAFEVQNWAKAGEPPSNQNIITSINGLAVTGQQGPVRGGDQPAPTPPSAPAIPQGRTDESESIFITGIVGRAMGSGKFGMDDILGLTQRARVAWQNRHTKYPEGPADDSYGMDPPPGDPYGP